MYFDGGSYGAIFVWSTPTNCYVTSVSPEFGTTSGSESCLCRATVDLLQITSARQKHDVWTGPKIRDVNNLERGKEQYF